MSRRKSLKLKLKELCTKIRFWLIKKLGGCTFEVRTIHQSVGDSQELVREYFVSNRYLSNIGLSTVEDCHVRFCAQSIADEIVSRGLYELRWSENFERDGKVLGVRVRVLPPARR